MRVYPWKSYRLRRETVEQLRALRIALKRQFLSYDELIVAMVTDYLSRRRTLQGQIRRLLESWQAERADPPADDPGRDDSD